MTVVAQAQSRARRQRRHDRLAAGLDHLVGFAFPGWAVKRAAAREQLRFLSAYRDTKTSRGHRSRRNLGGTANRHLSDSTLWTQRERVRSLVRENTLAIGLHQTDTDNVVWTGFVPQPKTADTTWNEKAKIYWQEELELDLRSELANFEFERAVYESVRRDGDMLLIQVAGRLQAIEADRVATPQRERGKGSDEAVSTVVHGRRFNGLGECTGYFVADEHPTSAYVTKADEKRAEDCIWVCSPHRITASRGRPVLFPIIDDLDLIEDATEATVWAYIMAACFGLIHKTRRALTDPTGSNRVTSQTNPSTGLSEYWEQLEPGMIVRAGLEDTFDQIKPNFPGAQFGELIKVLSRFCGRHLGLPLELVWLDFTANNYSNTRTALLQAYRTFQRLQMWFEWRFYRPAWQYCIGWAMEHGRLPKNSEYRHVRWQKPGWSWVDILDQAKARKLLVDNGLMSRQDAVADTGSDWFETARELHAEEEEIETQKLKRLVEPKAGKAESAEVQEDH